MIAYMKIIWLFYRSSTTYEPIMKFVFQDYEPIALLFSTTLWLLFALFGYASHSYNMVGNHSYNILQHVIKIV